MKSIVLSIKRIQLTVRAVCLLGCAVLSAVPARAQQDSPLSANFDLPLLINPARCGLNGEALHDYASIHSANLNYKSQMNGMFANYAIRVLSASYNILLLDRTMAAGIEIYTNTLNNAASSDFSANLTYAYHWNLSNEQSDSEVKHRLSFGLQAGFRRWAINLDRLQTGSMYDPAYSGGINPSLAPIYDFEELSRTVFDIQVGAHYTGWLTPTLNVQGGVSAYHLNRAQTGLGYVMSRTPVRFNVYGGAAWQSKEVPAASVRHGGGLEIDFEQATHEVSGTVTYINQNYYNMLEIAAMYRLYLCGDFSVGAGLAYRTLSQANVFSPMLSADIDSFTINIQCDFNCGTGGAFTNMFAIGLAYRL